MKVLVYYHNDLDGKCSAAIVKKALGKDIWYKFIPMGYNKTVKLPENISEYWRVYIVDFTMSEKIMDELCTLFPRHDVIWIEHHKTAIEQWGEKYSHFEGIRKDGIAASLLTWQFFYGQTTAPMAVQYIADRDLWYFKLEGTRRFNEFMMDANYAPWDSAWEYYLNPDWSVHNEIEKGEVLYNFKLNTIKKDIRYLGYEGEIDGYRCLIINYSSFEFISEMGNYICEELGYDIAWMYYYKKNDKDEIIQVNNLRSSKKGDVDVAEIAKKRGGGGHKNASGFAFKS